LKILEGNNHLAYICLIKVLTFTLWGDEIFGRHALSSRGWGSQDKRSIEPTLPLVRPTRVDH